MAHAGWTAGSRIKGAGIGTQTNSSPLTLGIFGINLYVGNWPIVLLSIYYLYVLCYLLKMPSKQAVLQGNQEKGVLWALGQQSSVPRAQGTVGQ